jgi:hypothetical protein
MPISVTGLGNADTRLVQQKLNAAPGSRLPRLVEDGVFGPKTRARIVEFQGQRGLAPDGIVGSRTRAALGLSAAPPNAQPPPTPGVGGESKVVNAVVSGFNASIDEWKATAFFSGLLVNGVTATGTPGCLTGPTLVPFMLARLSGLIGDDRAIANAAVEGIAKNFEAWQEGVTVPALPWYPAFAAVAAPMAPPTPNAPSLFAALTSAGTGGMTNAASLQAAMAAAADPSVRQQGASTFSLIASVVSAQFQLKVLMAPVKGVLGSGPVPTFAPPMIPVGPVVNGTALSTPGSLR